MSCGKEHCHHSSGDGGENLKSWLFLIGWLIWVAAFCYMSYCFGHGREDTSIIIHRYETLSDMTCPPHCDDCDDCDKVCPCEDCPESEPPAVNVHEIIIRIDNIKEVPYEEWPPESPALPEPVPEGNTPKPDPNPKVDPPKPPVKPPVKKPAPKQVDPCVKG